MKKVFCPQSGTIVWANATKKCNDTGLYRCTKCGDLHKKGGEN